MYVKSDARILPHRKKVSPSLGKNSAKELKYFAASREYPLGTQCAECAPDVIAAAQAE
jgi:hypothetical protein